MLTPELWPVYGGIGNYVLQVIRNMPKDVEIEIVAPGIPGGPSGEDSAARDLTSFLPTNTMITYLGGELNSISRRAAFQLMCKDYVESAVRKERFEVVHSANSVPDWLVNPRKLNVPLVSTVHTTIQGHYEALRTMGEKPSELATSERLVFLLGPVFSLAERTYYTNKRNYVTVSEWAKRQMAKEKHINASRIRVVQIGVDTDVFNPEKKGHAREFYPSLMDIDQPKVLFLSRMATRKGIGLLLKAIPRILEKVDAHFVFAGAGKKPDFSIPNSNYTYLGHVAFDRPPYLYALSDIFVLPSLFENFPACILEAMASECAVVATRICGIPEMIRHEENGLMIPPNSVDDIAGAVVRLIDEDDLRKRINKRARMDVVDKFSWQTTASNTKQYYEDLIESQKRRGN